MVGFKITNINGRLVASKEYMDILYLGFKLSDNTWKLSLRRGIGIKDKNAVDGLVELVMLQMASVLQ